MDINAMYSSHLDAGRSREIGKALDGPLSQFRAEMNADVAYLLFRHDSRKAIDVVAGDCADASARLLNGESITIANRLSTQVPQSVARVHMSSNMRAQTNEVTSALVVPWAHVGGQAWLVVGNLGRSGVVTNRARTPSRLAMAEQVRKAYKIGTARGARQLNALFRDSVDRLVEAERLFDTQGLLQTIASTARWFFDTSSSYISLPSGEPDKFTFVATECIHTAEFRGLSLGVDEGIGGLVRRERQSVRTTNYADDPRLRRGPMRETLQEGFKSAVCTPLWRDGELNGLLYIAQRDFRAFSDVDVGLLEEFASRSSEALTMDELRRFHEARVRRAERDRLSEILHDQVVAYLLDVGITAGMTAAETADPTSRKALESIQRNTQSCLDAIRACIAANNGVEASGSTILREIAAEFSSMSQKGSLRREVVLRPAADSVVPLPRELTNAVRTIGREALNNADRHSGGKIARLILDRVDDEIRMVIEDDGCGLPEGGIAQLLDRRGHLGLQRMRAIANSVGGSCKFDRSPANGLRITAILPFDRDSTPR